MGRAKEGNGARLDFSREFYFITEKLFEPGHFYLLLRPGLPDNL